MSKQIGGEKYLLKSVDNLIIYIILKKFYYKQGFVEHTKMKPVHAEVLAIEMVIYNANYNNEGINDEYDQNYAIEMKHVMPDFVP